jgi:uncharacterized membrane protein YhaH (DUF805 family)
MSQALEGTPHRGLTLTEQANGQRIGRAMFIGHTVGWLIIVALVVAGLMMLGFVAPGHYHVTFPTQPETIVDVPLLGLTPWATLGVAIFSMLVWTDLTVRRRHDRGRSGVDAVIFQMLLLASVVIHSFAEAPDIVGYLDALLVVLGLYLFVVLVLLPGNRGENRYGAVPKPD